eukprot:UN04278
MNQDELIFPSQDPDEKLAFIQQRVAIQKDRVSMMYVSHQLSAALLTVLNDEYNSIARLAYRLSCDIKAYIASLSPGPTRSTQSQEEIDHGQAQLAALHAQMETLRPTLESLHKERRDTDRWLSMMQQQLDFQQRIQKALETTKKQKMILHVVIIKTT